jgi:Phage protein Gp138 N-terminal domain/GpV Apex motif
MDTFGYTQQSPTDANSDFNVISFICRQIMATLATMMPVKVVAVTGGGGTLGAAGTVDVQPLVSMLDGNGNAMPHGTLSAIPYFRMQGGNGAVIMDPAVGDVGFAHFAMRDMSSVVASGGSVSTPGSLRQYDLADGIYVGGIINAQPTQYVQFTPQGITIADANGNMIVMSSGGVAITGNLTVTGSVTAGFGGADSVRLQTHTHGGVTTGGGTSAAPTAGT